MTFVKICGITNLEDAQTALELGADYLGFNFYPASPRYLDPQRCAEICKKLLGRHPSARLVGVFVNAPAETIRATLTLCHLHLAQLHGDETPDLLSSLNGQAYKAVRGTPHGNIADFVRYSPGFPGLLLDSQVAGAFGGTGIAADWPAAQVVASQFPIFLAGGLNPGNVAQAIAKVHPWGVDTASGVEDRPGKKDPDKLKAFIQAVRLAAQ